MEKYINLILKKHRISSDTVLINRKQDFSITAEDFVRGVLLSKNLAELTDLFEYNSTNSLKAAIMRNLKPFFPNKEGNSSWKKFLLISVEHKECSNCFNILPLKYFGKASTDKDNVRSICKTCASRYQKAYKQNNRKKFSEYQATREANKDKRTPGWADLKKIKEIYLNCPEDKEVDHIIPLQGKRVSGLHVEDNLQYLSKSENCRKGNRYSD